MNENKKTTTNKVTSLHVEALIHPSCPINFKDLETEIRHFVLQQQGGTSSTSTIVDDTPRQQHDDRHDGIDQNDTNSNANNSIANASSSKSSSSNSNMKTSENMVPQEGALDLSKASSLIQNACLEICIVDITSTTKSPSNLTTSSHVVHVHVHCYTLSTQPMELEEIDEYNNDEPTAVCSVLQLPHETIHTSWDNLIYPRAAAAVGDGDGDDYNSGDDDDDIKRSLLGYAESAIYFTSKGVSTHVISWNRVLLLHGPPGNGKSSLCRALAHKLCIRCNHLFPNGGYLLEVSSHSLFSKWFSESGKIISKLFDRIKEMVEEEPLSLFCIMMDEVESLASSRAASSTSGASSEPSDAIRAVNSILTNLDSIKQFPNIIIMTTTNITTMMDDAFMDRVDLKQYIGHPCLEARYEILKSCIEELIRVGIVNGDNVDNGTTNVALRSFDSLDNGMIVSSLSSLTSSDDGEDKDTNTIDHQHYYQEKLLLKCAKQAQDLSGRSLRKLPFQTHAFFLQSTMMTGGNQYGNHDNGDDTEERGIPLDLFLHALRKGIMKEQSARKDIHKK
jgi:hypothetical protein